jgi:protein involved in polysaccharide export with SLBB domain
MYKYFLILLLMCLNITGIFSQSMISQKNDLGPLQDLLNQPTPQVPTISFPLEHAIDPEAYILGPGDIIKIVVDAREDYSHQVTVNPEGSIFVSSIGEIPVSNMTLAEAKKQVSGQLKSKYIADNVNVILVQLRAFRVAVVGAVYQPGLVTASAVSRVSEAITLAGGLKTNQPKLVMMQQQMMVAPNQQHMVQQPIEAEELKEEKSLNEVGPVASRRNIRITRKNGQIVHVDLLKYYLTGSIESNPYLLDGDLIFVPFELANLGRIEISGAVNNPGEFEFVQGETVKDLLTLGHGFRIDADSSQIEIIRFSNDNKSTTSHVLPLSAETLQTELLADDRIYVRVKSNYHFKMSVTIRGEVMYPGTYALEEGRKSLLDLLERVGGFTKNASLKNSQVIRRTIEKEDDPEFDRLSRMRADEMTELEREYFKAKFREEKAVVAVDFIKLFENDDKSKDIILKNGDKIMIPTKELTVKVSGQVVRPGLFTFQPGQTVIDYISQSGGYSWNARKGQARIIRAETGEWAKANKKTKVNVGDTIFVPEKSERDWWVTSKDLITVVVQLATIFLVVDRYGTN